MNSREALKVVSAKVGFLLRNRGYSREDRKRLLKSARFVLAVIQYDGDKERVKKAVNLPDFEVRWRRLKRNHVFKEDGSLNLPSEMCLTEAVHFLRILIGISDGMLFMDHRHAVYGEVEAWL